MHTYTETFKVVEAAEDIRKFCLQQQRGGGGCMLCVFGKKGRLSEKDGWLCGLVDRVASPKEWEYATYYEEQQYYS